MATENQPGAGAAPMSEEDRFAEVAAAVDNTREQERKQEAKPPAAPENRPNPQPEARGAGGGAGDGQPTGDGRVRGPDGKFAPKPPPFEGFDQLPKAQQDYILSLQRERDRATNGYATTQRELEALRRTRQQPPPPKPQPQPSAKPEPSQQQPPTPRVLPKWEAGKKEYPDVYDSLEERVAAAETDLGRKLTATEERLAKVEQDLQETRQITSQYQADKAVEHRTQLRGYLDEVSPHWRRTAGREDDDGNPIPKEQQKYRPEFVAWMEAQPPVMQAMLKAQLKHSDPVLLGDVFQRFDRDYAAAMGWYGEGQGGGGRENAPRQPNPPPNPRRTALSDVQPRPGSGGAAPRAGGAETDDDAPAWDREEAAFAATATPQNMARYRQGGGWRGNR
jgi:hypothetical protein